MFARYFVELPFERGRVEQVLNDAPETWLPGYATSANHRGDQLLAEVGFGDDVRIARTVAIDVGAPIRLPTKSVLPVRWTAAGASGLFPALDADLERAIDRALLFRVAEATIKDFLDQVRDRIANELAATADEPALADPHDR
jgi:hypothetical protein